MESWQWRGLTGSSGWSWTSVEKLATLLVWTVRKFRCDENVKAKFWKELDEELSEIPDRKGAIRTETPLLLLLWGMTWRCLTHSFRARKQGTCGLAETCRTHNLRVVSSSPGTANVVVDLSKPLYSALFRRPERYLVATWWEYHNLTAVWSAPSIWSLTWYGCILKRRDSDDFIGWRNNGQHLEAALWALVCSIYA